MYQYPIGAIPLRNDSMRTLCLIFVAYTFFFTKTWPLHISLHKGYIRGKVFVKNKYRYTYLSVICTVTFSQTATSISALRTRIRAKEASEPRFTFALAIEIIASTISYCKKERHPFTICYYIENTAYRTKYMAQFLSGLWNTSDRSGVPEIRVYGGSMELNAIWSRFSSFLAIYDDFS